MIEIGRRIVDQLQRFRTGVLCVLVLGFVVSLVQLNNLAVDNSVEVWFPTTDPTLQEYHRFQGLFGNDEQVIIGVDLGRPVLTVEALEKIADLTEAVDKIDGIASALSLTNIPVINTSSGDVDVQSLQDMGITAASIDLIQQDPSVNQLIGKNPNATIILAQMETAKNMDAMRDGILRDVRSSLSVLHQVLTV